MGFDYILYTLTGMRAFSVLRCTKSVYRSQSEICTSLRRSHQTTSEGI